MRTVRWIPALIAAVALAGFLGPPAHAFTTVASHGAVAMQETAPPPPTTPTAPPPSAADTKAAQPAPAAANGAIYVGSDTCTTCHDTVEGQLSHTPHGSAAFGKLSSYGCETCHGPGSLHVDDPDNDALRPRVDTKPAKEINATCATCHNGHAQFFWTGGVHEKRGLSCTSCHSVHHPATDRKQLKMASVAEQCESCHQQVRAETWKNSHHPIREGKVTCTDCHNPHGSVTDKMVKADSINDLCYSCHTEKRGPFLWEHQPVRENCMNCHTPHGSNHAKLQRVSVPYLCQQCHANTRHPGTIYDARNTPQPEEGLPVPISPSNRLFERACVNCHAAIHGSNHPGSPYLGR
jgi:DmsE family decaheme c-type cytochrome